MPTSIKKLALILTVIVLLPVIIYTIYELNSLSENEKFLESIYTEQLNTIIFSVNQHVDDKLQSWVTKTEDIMQNDSHEIIEKELIDFCSLNTPISLIVIADSSISNDINFYSTKWQTYSDNATDRMQKILKNNYQLISELKGYKEKGYNKVQTLENKLDDTPLLSFLIDDGNEQTKIVTFVINMDEFISQIINKKINSISSNNLIVSIFHNEDLISYTGGEEILFEDLLEYEKIWNFPNYFLGISTTGTTIKEIVNERSTTSIILLTLLNILIIIGAWFVFKNISKEIKLSQLKSDFVSNVSHEIRTPLSLIGMFAETLEMHRVTTEEKKDEYYRIIRKETERLTRIVNSILSLSKMESSSKEYNFEKANLNTIVDEVVKTYQHEFEKNDCSVNKNHDLREIIIDQEAVIEALINLIDNALKYCEGKCKIEISTGMNDKYQFVEVTDNGMGIAKEYQKKIFEKFYRISSGNVHNSKGSGLGLSLVKHIMEAHGGNIGLESKIDKGSSFRLNFPIDNLNG
jgi:two-component system phosphate regulon sensor histidine kinase PhoR